MGYNSDEEIVNYKKIVPTEFFDNEAELSESEWGSEDENENDLDHLEKEAGDEDEIDQDRLKEELGRIHMLVHMTLYLSKEHRIKIKFFMHCMIGDI